jgi:uncharacterized protein (DUF1015 family)
MAQLFPLKALRPAPPVADKVAAVPYDVVSADEARTLVAGHPLSFLRVTRPEVDLPPDTNPYDARVYAQAVANFEALKRDAPLLTDDEPSLYLYRLRMGSHEQTGLAGCFSVDDYDHGLIKKHERTRKEKEDDRTRHMIELRAQTGVVFLTYRATAPIDSLVRRLASARPIYDFRADDGIAHTMWRVTGLEAQSLVTAFASVPALYIADGHHRVASASRARATLAASGGRVTDADRFVAVAFPDTEVQILPYHRVVKDLAGQTPEAVLAAIGQRMRVSLGPATPARAGDVAMFLAGRWHTVTLPKPPAGTSTSDALDVAVLEREVLAPFLGIGDIRSDKRVEFVGGARGTAELERLVTDGRHAVAFSMFPVSVRDLIAIADAGGIMPPKSTWFEPKLRDGLLVHMI